MKSFFYAVSESVDALVSRYPVVVAAVVAAFLANALTLVGPLDHSSRILDDLLMRQAPISLPPSRALIVEVPSELVVALSNGDHANNPTAVRDLTIATRRLRELGASQIAIGLVPDAAAELLADAVQHEDMLFGRRFAPAGLMASDSRIDGLLESLPDEYKPLSRMFGVLGMPDLEFGVARTQKLFVQVGNQVLPALESLLASRAGARATPVDQAPLRIDFRGGRHRLPTLDFARVVDGDLLATLVENRAVLIGAGPDPFIPGIATPLSGNGPALSELQYRGFVLDTLLRGAGLKQSTAISIALTSCAALLGALLGVALSFRQAISVSAMAIPVYIAAAWLSLGFLELQLPVVALMLAQPLSCSFVLFTRNSEERRDLLHAARRTSSLVRALPELPTEPSELDTIWPRLSRLLKTSVGIERLLFLEVSRDGETASEVHSEGCVVDPNRSHDLSDRPFAEAMRANLAIELTDHLFEADSPRCVHFLVPLSHGGKWLGFCALESRSYGPEHEEATLRSLREISALAGRLLAESSIGSSAAPFPFSFAGRGSLRPGGEGEASRLEANAELLFQRAETLQNIIDDGSVASAVFDLAGFVRQSNARMQTIATDYGLELVDTEPPLLISELTGLGIDRTRAVFRRVLIEDRKHVMPVRPLDGGTTRTLHVSPLKRSTSPLDDSTEAFLVQAVLIEIIDDEVAHQFHRQRARVAPIAQRANLEIDRLAQTIDKLSRETETDTTTMAELARSAGEAVTALSKGLETTPAPGDSNPHLIEASEPLGNAAEEYADECRARGISVVFDRPERPVFVETPETAFSDLLDACVSLLVRDATDSSTLVLQVVELPDEIEYDMRNQGYGMPSDILRKGLSEVDDGSLADLTRIRRALPETESAGADFTISSEVGEGIRIKLIMPRAL